MRRISAGGDGCTCAPEEADGNLRWTTIGGHSRAHQADSVELPGLGAKSLVVLSPCELVSAGLPNRAASVSSRHWLGCHKTNVGVLVRVAIHGLPYARGMRTSPRQSVHSRRRNANCSSTGSPADVGQASGSTPDQPYLRTSR